ncbi:GlsB/YeaQ/YmgE family stress response membrane protein [uncultured Nocardioides sp.]|uniref:GlsB/YeaQ/YmgE family stress response membrane protein n=1 Tax=uncultured Nocardioides sp. TaxID=198441 RepID=UPI0025DD9B2D|nr:GlsB/YeaQ/YmgE family stress response membrane protein [uncultured Nocardioides sp.]
MEIGTILFYLVVGAIVGLLGKFLAPGDKDNIPLWLVLVCGIGGMLLGDVIYRAFGGDGSRGLDWVQGIVAVLTAMVLVIIASTLTGRSRSSRGHRV